MKKLLTLFVTIFLLIGTFSFALAEENNSILDSEDIVLPEPGRIGWFENTWDKWRLAWTFNNEARIEKALSIAEERLAEAEQIADKNPERAKILRERYIYFIKKAEKSMNKLESLEDTSPSKLNRSMENLARTQARIEVHSERVIFAREEVLKRLKTKNVSQDKLDEVSKIFIGFENRSNRLSIGAKERRSRVETKFKVLAKKNDSEMLRIRNMIDNKQGFTQAKLMREHKKIERSEVQKRMQKRVIESLNEKVNLTYEEKEAIKEGLENAKNNLQSKTKDLKKITN